MGVITLPANVETDRQNGVKASSVHVQGNFDALLTAVNRKLEIDGSIVPTADIPMGNHKLTGVATPTLTGDATNKGYVDTLDGQNVKVTGNQTIAGTKTFSSTITGSISGNAGTVTNGVYTTGNQTIGGVKIFSSVAYGQASDDSNSLLSTVAKSKANSGYFKLGNGLIVQWGGVFGGAYPTAQWVTLPTPFTTTDYAVSVIPTGNGLNYTQTGFIPNILYTTGFDVVTGFNGGDARSLQCRWIAIGY